MSFGKYILNPDRTYRPVKSLTEWANWFENANARIVRQEMVGGYKVSTVFLSLDHSYEKYGPPVLWETMVFGEGKLDQSGERCSGTWEDAEKMHHRMVQTVMAEQFMQKLNENG